MPQRYLLGIAKGLIRFIIEFDYFYSNAYLLTGSAMQNRNRSLSAREGRFRSFCASKGCAIGGGPAQLHHLFGSSAKVKVGFDLIHIGEIAIIPLSYFWHMNPQNPNCVDLFPRAFEEATGTTEKLIWLDHALEFGEFSDDEINAVMNYSKSNRSFGFDVDEYRLNGNIPELLQAA